MEDAVAEEKTAAAPLDLCPGTVVRISQVKGAFEKVYAPNWIADDFRIVQVVEEDAEKGGRTTFKLEDRAGELLAGSWYREELIPISANRFIVERVLRRPPIKMGALGEEDGNANENQEYLVKSMGWPAEFNTSVPKSDLVLFNRASE